MYEQQRRRRVLYGRSNLVPAGPVRDHIRALGAQGMGWKRVAKLSGVSMSGVAGILYGRGKHSGNSVRPPRKQVTREVAEKILSVRLDIDDINGVDATGTRRRVEALVLAGWPIVHIADRIGVDAQRLRSVLNGRRDRTSVETRRLVQQFFRTAVQGPDARVSEQSRAGARRYAESRGWVPALAWDDIDDPDAVPDVTAIRPRRDRAREVDQRIEDLEDLAAFGEQLSEETARRAGWNTLSAMLGALRRVGRLDLIDQLRANEEREERRRA